MASDKSKRGSESENPAISSPTPKRIRPRTNKDWWPNQLDLSILHYHSHISDPMGETYNYAKEFKTLDVEALKRDLIKVMTTSQEWWPADYGHYGPFFIRLTWHAAGTYRIADGRGGGGKGMQRFAPLNSWPDNANLDKARRLLWPIKQKYGRKISWADLLVFAGHVATEHMGLKTFGFGFGRPHVLVRQEPYRRPDDTWLCGKRHATGGDIHGPFGADHMGLIYVNPEGPNGNPDPLLAAKYIRQTFKRMAMNDEETLALIVGGHTFGKAHGAAPAPQNVGPEPEGASLEDQGLGWKNRFGSGKGAHMITSGLEGPWTSEPTKRHNGLLDNLLDHEWELTTSPAGAKQWTAKKGSTPTTAPDAHDRTKRQPTMMLTTDLALKMDPIYAPIAKRFHEHPDQLAEAFAKAWYKLLHRDMGPITRYLGSWVPAPQLWQDPVPAVNHPLVAEADIAGLKAKILASGVSIPHLVSTAWAAAASFRGTDKRGGANGARIRLSPQKNWEVNNPAELAKTLQALERIQSEFNRTQTGGKKVSLADLIVLGGCAAVEQAAKNAGHNVTVPFKPGRTDASQEQTDVESFAALEPTFDGFRNYYKASREELPSDSLLVERAYLLNLTAPEMTVLLGGMRALNANVGQSQLGVFTKKPGTLTNDFFVNLLDMSTEWKASATDGNVYEGHDRATGERKWTGSAVDLVFGYNSQLRALAEVYASADAKEKFVRDFVAAWDKVMNLDRFDLV